MRNYLFIWCLMAMPSGLYGSRIVDSVPEDRKYDYSVNVFKLLCDDSGKEATPLHHLLYKARHPKYSIPTCYKKLLKQYDFYRNGVYIIDCTIIKSILLEYMCTDSDDISDDEPEEMPRD